MITTIALLSLLALPMPTVIELLPTDDVWAYPHASDPDKDPFLRVWGLDGASVAPSAAESDSFGYSFLKFDAAGIPEKNLKSATLLLVHTAKPSFDLALAKQHPLEARPVSASFTEKTWGYGDLDKFMPASGKGAVYGTGVPEAFDAEKDFPIKINLMEGPGKFDALLLAARGTKSFAIALTTTLSPDGDARSIYKVYSIDGPKENRPVLRLEFED
jgi:hypothetical protein